MSSSLKERLRKCGRYHPAAETPNTPKSLDNILPSVCNAIKSSTPNHLMHTAQPVNSDISGPIRLMSNVRTLFSDTVTHSSCANESNDTSSHLTPSKMLNESEQLMSNSCNDSSIWSTNAVNVSTIQTIDVETDVDRVVSATDTMSNVSKVHVKELSNANNVDLHSTPSNNIDMYSCQTISDTDSFDSVPLSDLVTKRLYLTAQLSEQEELLRRLNVVKVYRAKVILVCIFFFC